MRQPTPRPYHSERRRQAAEKTRERVLATARALFEEEGIDSVPLRRIAAAASVAESTIYALFKSKEGILRELMRKAIFNARYEVEASRLNVIDDPIDLLRLTARIARTIYENEARELGLMRGMSLFSRELKKMEEEFEAMRLEMQRNRLQLFADRGLLPPGLSLADARHILWMYTSREIYRMLVVESGWAPDKFESWLADTLITALHGNG